MDVYLRSSDMVEHSTKNRLCCFIVQSRDFQIWPDSLLPEHSILAEQRGHFYARFVGWHC